MAKKKDEKDVLVVRDEKTGEISVVAGLNADGSPKRIPAKAENAQSFLQFDRHGDVLDNFFRNFFRQCREPSRFGFYRVAADQAEKGAQAADRSPTAETPENDSASRYGAGIHRGDVADIRPVLRQGAGAGNRRLQYRDARCGQGEPPDYR